MPWLQFFEFARFRRAKNTACKTPFYMSLFIPFRNNATKIRKIFQKNKRKVKILANYGGESEIFIEMHKKTSTAVPAIIAFNPIPPPSCPVFQSPLWLGPFSWIPPLDWSFFWLTHHGLVLFLINTPWLGPFFYSITTSGALTLSQPILLCRYIERYKNLSII